MEFSRPVPTYVRQLAAELEMLAGGSTQAFNPAGGASVPDSRAPSGDPNPPHELFLKDWDAHGDRVLERWLGVLKEWKGCGRVRPAGKTDREIVLEAGAGYSPDDVAVRYRLTATMVRRWRLEDGRNVQTGMRVEVKGRTQQQIADELGVSQPTVHRLRKRAA